MSSRSNAAFYAVGGVVTVGATVTVLTFGPYSAVAAIIAALFVALALLKRRMNQFYLSPVTIAVAAYVGLAVVGGALYPSIESARYGGGIRLLLADDLYSPTIWVLVIAAAALLAGASLPLLIAKLPPRAAFEPSIPIDNRLLLLAATLPILIIIIAYEPSNLWSRGTYLAESPGRIAALGTQLGLGAALILGSVFAKGKQYQRVLALALMVTLFTIFFSLGSRRMAMLIVLFAVGQLIGSPTRLNKLMLIPAAFFTFVLLQLPLFLRGLPSHGLEPYLAHLHLFPDAAAGLDSVARSFLISFALIAVTAFDQPPIPVSDIWIMVNPMPGVQAGWYDIVVRHQLNPWTPYPAVGEIANQGLGWVIGFFFVIGFLFGYFEQRIRKLLVDGQPVIALAIFGLVSLFVVFSIQYPLRSAARMLWYAIALDVGVYFVAAMRVRRYAKPPPSRVAARKRVSADG